MNDPRGRRPVGELITLLFASAVCASIFAAVIAVALILVLEPGTDVGAAASSLGTLISALAGFLIGRAARVTKNGNGNGGPHG